MVDVVALGVAHWTEYLNIDANKAEEERRKKAEAEWERKLFSNSVFGSARKAPTGVTARRGWGRPLGRR
jgi:hypothetical protein